MAQTPDIVLSGHYSSTLNLAPVLEHQRIILVEITLEWKFGLQNLYMMLQS